MALVDSGVAAAPVVGRLGPSAPLRQSIAIDQQKVISLLPPDCNTERNNISVLPEVYFVTITALAGNANADVPLIIPRPCRIIMLASILAAHMNDSLFMHFSPLGKAYNSTQINANGTEAWFPFCNSSAGATAMTKIGLYYKFNKPLPQTIYFDIGLEVGGGSNVPLTFMLTNDIESIGQLMNSTS